MIAALSGPKVSATADSTAERPPDRWPSHPHVAPPVQWPLRPAAQPRRIAWAASALAAAVLLGWRWQAQVNAALWWALFVLSGLLSVWAVRMLAKPLGGSLVWRDGVWHWLPEPGRGAAVGLWPPQVVWPGQRHLWLALRVQASGDARAQWRVAWVWVSQNHDPSQWLALRRAVFHPGLASHGPINA
ncbi:MAG: hypothetical protein OHK0048_05870 [Rhodoferax sp.]